MPLSGGGSSSKPTFFPGQRENFITPVFAEGGPVASLLTGAPDPGFEAGVQRGSQRLGESLSDQGLTGSGLAAKAFTDFGTRATQGREALRMDQILKFIQPAGTSSISNSGLLGLFQK
jgi:hypothetical protein